MAVPRSESDILRRIRRIEDREPETLNEEEYGLVVEWLAHSSAQVRKAAADAITLTNWPIGPATHLLERLPAETDPEVRAQVIDSLIMLATMEQDRVEMESTDEDEEPDYEKETGPWYRQVRETLLRVAADTSEAEPVRAAAIGGLGDLSDDPAMKGTYLAYLGGPQPALQAAALRAVSYSGDAHGAESAILAGIDDAEPEIRKWALLAAGNTHLEAATEKARHFLTATDPEVQGAAWYAFAGCAPVEEARALLERIGAEIDEEDPRYDDYDAAQYVLAEREGYTPGWGESFDGFDGEEELPEGESIAMEPQLEPQTLTVRRESPKVGRNEPCPCGSGKKYKKCCGA